MPKLSTGDLPSLVIAPPVRLRRRRGGRLPSRLSTWLRRSDIDSRLADGTDPHASAELSERAAQLTGARARRTVALGLERILREAGRPAAWSSAAPINRGEIEPARSLLSVAAQRLRSADPVSAQGVVLFTRLLTDPAGPLYTPCGDDTLTRESALALRALYAGPRDG